MRSARIGFICALLALAAVAPAHPAPAAVPTLRFVDLTPVVVRGARFAPGTKVRVTLVAGATKLSRVVRVSAGGGFVAGFGTVSKEDRCSGSVRVVAFRAGGRRTTYRLPPMACTTGSIDKVEGTDKAGATDRSGVGSG